METPDRQSLILLLKRAGIEPDDDDLERFRPLIEQYLAALGELHSFDVSDEEIAPTFRPQWSVKK